MGPVQHRDRQLILFLPIRILVRFGTELSLGKLPE
jgi:hypothetical protein